MYSLLSLSVVKGNSLVIAMKLKDDALVFNVMYGDGQPLTLGIVVSVYSMKSAEVMHGLD